MPCVQTRRRIARTLLASICTATGTQLFFLSARASAANTSDIFDSGSALDAAGDWSDGSVPGPANDAIILSGWPTSAAALTLNSNQSFGSLDVLNTNAITIANPTSGNVSTLTLGGTGNQGNGFTGTANDLLYVGAGANLSIGNGDGTLNLTLGQAGNLNINGAASISSAITSSYTTTLTGSGTLSLSGANTFSGGLTVSNGTLSQTAGTMTIGALTIGGGSTNATFNALGGVLNATSATIGSRGTYSQSAGENATFGSLNASSAAAFSFNGGSITVNGGTCSFLAQSDSSVPGAPVSYAWFLSGSASPVLTLAAGAFGGSSLGQAAAGILGMSGGSGTIAVTGKGSTLSGSETIVLGDGGSTTGGVFTPSNGSLNLSDSATEGSPYLYIGYGNGIGTLTIQSGASINCGEVILGYEYASGTINVSNGGASQGSLAIGSDGGTGTFTLGVAGQTDTSSWTSGQTTVGGNNSGDFGTGTLNLNPGTTLNAGLLEIYQRSGTGGGTVNLNGATLVANALLMGGGTLNWSSGTFNPGPITQSGGSINNSTGQPLTVGSSGAVTTKYVQTAGSYTGDLSINNGGTFYGVNVSGNVAVNSGGTIGASNAAIATLTTGNETWGSGATYVWKFNLKGAGTGTAGTPAVQNPTGGGTTADQIDASSLALPTGLVTINITGFNGSQGTAFNPNLNYAWAVADVKPAANLTGLNPQLFVLNTFNAGFTPSSSAFSISGAPDGAGGEDLIIYYTGAPEPGSAILLGASAPLLLLRRRRTTKSK